MIIYQIATLQYLVSPLLMSVALIWKRWVVDSSRGNICKCQTSQASYSKHSKHSKHSKLQWIFHPSTSPRWHDSPWRTTSCGHHSIRSLFVAETKADSQIPAFINLFNRTILIRLLMTLISDIQIIQCSHDNEYCFNMLQHCDPSSGHPWLPLSVFSRPCAVIIMGRSTLLSQPEVVATAVPTAVSTAVPTTVPVPKHDQNSVTCRNLLKCWKAPMSPKTAMEKLASADCEADTKLHTFGDVINWHQSLWVDWRSATLCVGQRCGIYCPCMSQAAEPFFQNSCKWVFPPHLENTTNENKWYTWKVLECSAILFRASSLTRRASDHLLSLELPTR